MLCDGSSGTPDLRDRFVVGAGSTYSVAATGGANTVTLSASEIPSHTHSFSGTTSSSGSHTHSASTSSSGAHTHPPSVGSTYLVNNTGGTPTALEAGATFFTGGNSGGQTASAGSHTHTVTVNSDGSHTHTVSGTTGSSGSGSAHENRPPYYALCYIMKA